MQACIERATEYAMLHDVVIAWHRSTHIVIVHGRNQLGIEGCGGDDSFHLMLKSHLGNSVVSIKSIRFCYSQSIIRLGQMHLDCILTNPNCYLPVTYPTLLSTNKKICIVTIVIQSSLEFGYFELLWVGLKTKTIEDN